MQLKNRISYARLSLVPRQRPLGPRHGDQEPDPAGRFEHLPSHLWCHQCASLRCYCLHDPVLHPERSPRIQMVSAQCCREYYCELSLGEWGVDGYLVDIWAYTPAAVAEFDRHLHRLSGTHRLGAVANGFSLL